MRCIAEGEASVDLAAAALYVAAEDDALVSHSTVQASRCALAQPLAQHTRFPAAVVLRRCVQVAAGFSACRLRFVFCANSLLAGGGACTALVHSIARSIDTPQSLCARLWRFGPSPCPASPAVCAAARGGVPAAPAAHGDRACTAPS